MARLNIEDNFWSDIRLQLLAERIGYTSAVGSMVVAFKLAQQFWVQGKLIPEKIWQASRISEEIFEVGFAERRDEGVYVCGSERHFAWYMEKVEAGRRGGQKSAQRPRNSKGHFEPSKTPENIQANPSTAWIQAGPSPSKPKPLTLALTPALNTTAPPTTVGPPPEGDCPVVAGPVPCEQPPIPLPLPKKTRGKRERSAAPTTGEEFWEGLKESTRVKILESYEEDFAKQEADVAALWCEGRGHTLVSLDAFFLNWIRKKPATKKTLEQIRKEREQERREWDELLKGENADEIPEARFQ